MNDAKVRRYFASLNGDFVVHDFRTWNATEAALQAIAAHAAPATAEAYWDQRDAVADIAAAKIGDTRAVALESYIDPAVFDAWRIHAGIPENAERPRRARKTAETEVREQNAPEELGRDAGVLRDASLSEPEATAEDRTGQNEALTQDEIQERIRQMIRRDLERQRTQFQGNSLEVRMARMRDFFETHHFATPEDLRRLEDEERKQDH